MALRRRLLLASHGAPKAIVAGGGRGAAPTCFLGCVGGQGSGRGRGGRFSEAHVDAHMLNFQVIGPRPHMGCQPGHKGVGAVLPRVVLPQGGVPAGTVKEVGGRPGGHGGAHLAPVARGPLRSPPCCGRTGAPPGLCCTRFPE